MRRPSLYDLRLGILNGMTIVFRPFCRLYRVVALYIWMIQLTLEWKTKKRVTHGTSIRGTMGTWIGASSLLDFFSIPKTTLSQDHSTLSIDLLTPSLDTETCSSTITSQKIDTELRRIQASGEFC